jgi:hypothetical protein
MTDDSKQYQRLSCNPAVMDDNCGRTVPYPIGPTGRQRMAMIRGGRGLILSRRCEGRGEGQSKSARQRPFRTRSSFKTIGACRKFFAPEISRGW